MEQLTRRERRRMEREQKRQELVSRKGSGSRKKSAIGIGIVILVGLFLYSPTFFAGGNSVTGSAAQNTQLQKVSFSDAMGEKAPDFTLESLDGRTVRLSDYRGKTVVLFFNEGTMCYPACWDQVTALSTDERLNNDDVVSFSIVVNQKKEWEQMSSQLSLLKNVNILFDVTRAVSLSYDVLSLSSSMHKGYYPGHTYVIVDKEGTIRYVFDDPSMGVRDEQLVAEVEKLR